MKAFQIRAENEFPTPSTPAAWIVGDCESRGEALGMIRRYREMFPRTAFWIFDQSEALSLRFECS